ncbi:uncharacterized protein LOC130828764 [Amaranthus tricolor]|uniref:uncharacterized protein LOC130828764 n=1 Tax=Amaranthus tricolor TaxID=29722 RepID=UPI00258BF092|nr:uncharacterized protein LOC130828764 [Amaranthus tricolor]
MSRKKSGKVADETMFDADNRQQLQPIWNNRLLVIYTIVHIPFSILSRFFKRRTNISDTTWVTGDIMRSSEIDQFTVSDSMRHAILM